MKTTLTHYQNVYFLGIGGIGMSALARWFHQQGKTVFGYDKTPSPLTSQLEDEGIKIHFDDVITSIPPEIAQHKENSLIVYTPAIPKNHKIWNHLNEVGYIIRKRAVVLGMISQEHFTVAVAGTHGKTSTCAMIAHLLYTAGKPMVALVGGILKNYESNFITQGDIRSPDSIAVLEADEFDRSFLQLSPDIGILTAADPDHLDIYHNQATIEEAFRAFLERVSSKENLILQKEASKKLFPTLDNKVTYYALDDAPIHADNLFTKEGRFHFDYVSEEVTIPDIALAMPGFHNVENALAAITVALKLDLTPKQIQQGFATFKGIKRRFEYIVQQPDIVYIDDYAHHPTELTALLKSVRKLYPNKKITAIFQPHLFTRTRDFAKGFSKSLCFADITILLPIYPARELPIEGVTSRMLFEGMDMKEKYLCEKEDLLRLLQQQQKSWGSSGQVLLTIGAGDIDRLVDPIKEWLEEN